MSGTAANLAGESRPLREEKTTDVQSRPAFSSDAFAQLVRAEYVEAGDRVGRALRRGIPSFSEAPDVATAWVYGLYATVLGRLPDRGGLASFTEGLRSGLSPADACLSLIRSEEGVSTGASDPPDLDEVFVTGAYITAMGRAPDDRGMAVHVRVLQDGGTPGSVLHALVTSTESTSKARFPPAPISRGQLIAESMQVILLSRQVPDRSLTRRFAGAYDNGASTREVAKAMLRLGRRPRGVARSFVLTRTLIRLIEVDATARGAQLEALANRRWQWQVDRKAARKLQRALSSLEHLSPGADAARGPGAGGHR